MDHPFKPSPFRNRLVASAASTDDRLGTDRKTRRCRNPADVGGRIYRVVLSHVARDLGGFVPAREDDPAPRESLPHVGRAWGDRLLGSSPLTTCSHLLLGRRVVTGEGVLPTGEVYPWVDSRRRVARGSCCCAGVGWWSVSALGREALEAGPDGRRAATQVFADSWRGRAGGGQQGHFHAAPGHAGQSVCAAGGEASGSRCPSTRQSVPSALAYLPLVTGGGWCRSRRKQSLTASRSARRNST
jgi:hypothetical protein